MAMAEAGPFNWVLLLRVALVDYTVALLTEHMPFVNLSSLFIIPTLSVSLASLLRWLSTVSTTGHSSG